MPSIFKTVGVYKITNILNGDFYIGSSIHVENRWKGHKREAKRASADYRSRLYAAMRKYGIANFSVTIVEECEVDVLLLREQYYLDTLQPPYNIKTKVGDLHRGPTGYQHTEEWKAERARQQSEHMLTPERREQSRLAREGKTYVELFGDRANEVKQKIKDNRTPPVGMIPWNAGVRMSEEHCAKLSEIKKALLTPERLAKLAPTQFQKGQVAHNKGVPMSEEQKRHQSEMRKGKMPRGIADMTEEQKKERTLKMVQTKSSTGAIHVTFRSRTGKYSVAIKGQHYGSYPTLEAAVARRDEVLATLG